MAEQPREIETLATLLNEMNRSPIKALRRCKEEYQEDDELHSNCIASTIAFIVALTRRLDGSIDLRNEFQNEKIFDDDSRSIRKLSVGVARFIVCAKAEDGAKYEKARSYAEIADHFVHQAILPAQVAAQLMVTKPYTLLKQIKAQKAEELEEEGQFAPRRRTDIDVETPTGSAMPKAVARDKEDSASTDIEGFNTASGHGKETHPLPRRGKSPPTRPKFDKETMIILDGMNFQSRVRNIGHGNAIWLKVRCEPLNEKWNRFLIEEVRAIN